MDELYFFLLFLLIVLSILLFSFSKPLDGDQISKLALKRRGRRIIRYFFQTRGYIPSKQFKSSLKPDGKLYQIDLDMAHVPYFVANLLKYKKHEWSVIAFIGNREAKYLWANKGPDRSQVTLLSINSIINTAKNNHCDVIMAFHNHPAHDPQHYSYRKPSNMDLQTADRFSQLLNSIDISYLDHVCERGRPYRYCLKPSETLHPFQAIQEETTKENMQGRMAHIKLHFELYF